MKPPSHTLNRAPSQGGPGTHFPHKLPPASSGEMRKKFYRGPSADRYQEIRDHDRTKRSNLAKSLTKSLQKDAQDAQNRGRSMTAEAAGMTAPGATMATVEAQRNHTNHASGALDLAASTTLDMTSRSPTRRRQGSVDALELTRIHTGGSPRTTKKIAKVVESLERKGSSASTEDAARATAKIAKTADHRYNVDFGNDGRNMAMSNRADVMTSPGGTRVRQRDLTILESLRPMSQRRLGPELTQTNLGIPTSPRGGHVLSSKTATSAPPASPPLLSLSTTPPASPPLLSLATTPPSPLSNRPAMPLTQQQPLRRSSRNVSKKSDQKT